LPWNRFGRHFFNVVDAVVVELQILQGLLPKARDFLGQIADIFLIEVVPEVLNTLEFPLVWLK
jgi:hypothetical protein